MGIMDDDKMRAMWRSGHSVQKKLVPVLYKTGEHGLYTKFYNHQKTNGSDEGELVWEGVLTDIFDIPSLVLDAALLSVKKSEADTETIRIVDIYMDELNLQLYSANDVSEYLQILATQSNPSLTPEEMIKKLSDPRALYKAFMAVEYVKSSDPDNLNDAKFNW